MIQCCLYGNKCNLHKFQWTTTIIVKAIFLSFETSNSAEGYGLDLKRLYLFSSVLWILMKVLYSLLRDFRGAISSVLAIDKKIAMQLCGEEREAIMNQQEGLELMRHKTCDSNLSMGEYSLEFQTGNTFSLLFWITVLCIPVCNCYLPLEEHKVFLLWYPEWVPVLLPLVESCLDLLVWNISYTCHHNRMCGHITGILCLISSASVIWFVCLYVCLSVYFVCLVITRIMWKVMCAFFRQFNKWFVSWQTASD